MAQQIFLALALRPFYFQSVSVAKTPMPFQAVMKPFEWVSNVKRVLRGANMSSPDLQNVQRSNVFPIKNMFPQTLIEYFSAHPSDLVYCGWFTAKAVASRCLTATHCYDWCLAIWWNPARLFDEIHQARLFGEIHQARLFGEIQQARLLGEIHPDKRGNCSVMVCRLQYD